MALLPRSLSMNNLPLTTSPAITPVVADDLAIGFSSIPCDYYDEWRRRRMDINYARAYSQPYWTNYSYPSYYDSYGSDWYSPYSYGSYSRWYNRPYGYRNRFYSGFPYGSVY